MAGNHSNQQTPVPNGAHDNAAIKFLENLFATQPDEIQCDAAAVQIIQCADRNFTDEAARKRYPALFHHFRYCPDCAAEYTMIMEFVREQAAGLVQRPAAIPPRPAYQPPAARPAAGATAAELLAAAKGVAEWLMDTLTPMQLAPAVRGAQQRLDDRPVTARMAGGAVTLTLTVKQEPGDPARRQLLCTVAATDGELAAALEMAPIQLRSAENDANVQEQTLDDLGDATFTAVPPGVYALHWSLAGQNFVAAGLEIT